MASTMDRADSQASQRTVATRTAMADRGQHLDAIAALRTEPANDHGHRRAQPPPGPQAGRWPDRLM
jgi:hypothetical protein